MTDVNDSLPVDRLRESVLGRSARIAVDARARMRRDHLLRVLDGVAELPDPVTRAAIVRETGLTSATVSSLMSELIDLGFVVEGAQAESTGGKPATRVGIAPDGFVVLVVLVRALSIETALVDLTGRRIAERWTERADGVAPADVAAAAAALAGSARGRILAVGVQTPGVTDGRRVIESVLLGWADVPLAALVEQHVGVPVLLVNDAVGEALTEAAGDRDPALQRLTIRLGEGVGAAVTIGGTFQSGASGRAGEIGHARFGAASDAEDRLCRCGRRGCLEATASLTAMLGPDYHDELDEEHVRVLARSPQAAALLEEGAEALAGALRALSALADPHEIVLAGRARFLGEEFLRRVAERFAATPARGTGNPGIRYAGALDACLGPGRLALEKVLGVPLLPGPRHTVR